MVADPNNTDAMYDTRTPMEKVFQRTQQTLNRDEYNLLVQRWESKHLFLIDKLYFLQSSLTWKLKFKSFKNSRDKESLPWKASISTPKRRPSRRKVQMVELKSGCFFLFLALNIHILEQNPGTDLSKRTICVCTPQSTSNSCFLSSVSCKILPCPFPMYSYWFSARYGYVEMSINCHILFFYNAQLI